MSQKAQQMDLMAFGGLLVDEAVGHVFKSEPIKKVGKDGVERTLGQKFRMQKKSEIAESLQLKGKANKEALEDAVIAARQAGWRTTRAMLSSLDESWGLKAGEMKKTASGEEVIMVRISRMPVKVITAEMIAKAWDIPLEKAQEIIASHVKIASPVHDITSEPAEPVAEIQDGAVPTDNLPADAGIQQETEPMSDEDLEKLTAPGQ